MDMIIQSVASIMWSLDKEIRSKVLGTKFKDQEILYMAHHTTISQRQLRNIQLMEFLTKVQIKITCNGDHDFNTNAYLSLLNRMEPK